MYKFYIGWTIFCIVGCLGLNYALVSLAFENEAEGPALFIMIFTHSLIWILLWGIPTIVVIGVTIYRWLKRWNQKN